MKWQRPFLLLSMEETESFLQVEKRIAFLPLLLSFPFPFPFPSLPPFFYLPCFLSFSSPPPLIYHFLPPSFPTISFPTSLLRIGVCGQKVRFAIPKGMCVSLVYLLTFHTHTPFQNPLQEKPHLKSRYIWFSLLSSGCPTHLFFLKKQYSRFSRSLAHSGFTGTQLNTLVGT